MPGNPAHPPRLIVTGQLGDVMRESAMAALSYVRGHAHELAPELPRDFFATHDIHLHVPSGATPKDGPSAGITMATALMSLVTGRPVRSETAMTGEITLTGQVLPIGGLKEKALAAQRVGIKRVIAPKPQRVRPRGHPRAAAQGPRVPVGGGRRRGLRGGARAAPERAEAFQGACRGYARREPERDSEREVSKLAAKKKAAKAGAAAMAVKNSPYVQRVVEDEDLRENIVQAYESARDAASRLSNGKSPAKAIFDDKKLQKDLKNAAESFRDASVALREAPKQRKGLSFGRLAAAHRGQRRRRAGGVRGPAQEGARRAVRRRGGVRVHLDDRHAAPGAGGHAVRLRVELLDRQQRDIPEDRGRHAGRDPELPSRRCRAPSAAVTRWRRSRFAASRRSRIFSIRFSAHLNSSASMPRPMNTIAQPGPGRGTSAMPPMRIAKATITNSTR